MTNAFADLTATLEARAAAQNHIVQSLAHYDRETAMHLILSWTSIADLHDIAPTLAGSPVPGDPSPPPMPDRPTGEAMVDYLATTLSRLTGSRWIVSRGKVPEWRGKSRASAHTVMVLRYGLRIERGEFSHTFRGGPLRYRELVGWMASIADMIQMGFIRVLPTDHVGMRAVVEALGFEPDNHHRSVGCPYCQEHHG